MAQSSKKKKKKTSAALLWLSREKEHMKQLYIRSLTKKEVSCILAFRELSNFLKITNSLQMSLQKGFKKKKKKR